MLRQNQARLTEIVEEKLLFPSICGQCAFLARIFYLFGNVVVNATLLHMKYLQGYAAYCENVLGTRAQILNNADPASSLESRHIALPSMQQSVDFAKKKCPLGESLSNKRRIRFVSFWSAPSPSKPRLPSFLQHPTSHLTFAQGCTVQLARPRPHHTLEPSQVIGRYLSAFSAAAHLKNFGALL